MFKAVNRSSRKTVARVTGNRDIATFRRLYDKLKHLKKRKFFTDNWGGFSAVLPKRRHKIGKEHTTTIEQNNSDTRHYLGRMTRRTKVVSKSEEMLNISMKLLCALQNEEAFDRLQNIFLSIYN